MSTKCQRRGVGGPSNVNVDRNEWWWVRFIYIIIQFTYSVFQENPDSHINTMRVRILLEHTVRKLNNYIRKTNSSPLISVNVDIGWTPYPPPLTFRWHWVIPYPPHLVNVNCERPRTSMQKNWSKLQIRGSSDLQNLVLYPASNLGLHTATCNFCMRFFVFFWF